VIGLLPGARVFFARTPTDMRRSFDGLFALTKSYLGQDPFSGHLFVFRNRPGDRVKVLYWDRSGLAIWYKRLEKGTFRFPDEGTSGPFEITAAELVLILEGIDLAGARRQVRYERAKRKP
jgi:transposase